LDWDHIEEVIHSFILNQQAITQSILLKDYNDQTPSTDLIVVTRIMGLILAATAVEFIYMGIADLFPILAGGKPG
jgi:uncharacterized protein involved in type VI secretion and phage assembly